MEIIKLLFIKKDKEITSLSWTLYKPKIGLLFFIAIIAWPNIVFEVFRPIQFKQ